MNRKKGTSQGYRHIPSVDSLLRRDDMAPLIEAHGRALVTEAVREAVAAQRDLLAGEAGGEGADGQLLDRVRARVSELVARRTTSTMRRVINATGVIVHTNLGRAVLSEEAGSRVARAASAYSTLEYDLEAGGRGSRSSHLRRGLSVLFPGHGSLAVNNNAAAVLLALNSMAEGREVVISRGELVEIGGSFRIPDIMAKSGARLREVGTTNRTRLSDYERAIGPGTGLLLKVHRSNFRVVGFTEEAGTAALAALARSRGIPLLVDQGSGAMLDLSPAGIRDEPTVMMVLEAGADVVTFSGDKILGGPQAGIAVGRRDLIDAMTDNPLYRALRLDKMTIAALEGTLDAYARGTHVREIPVLRMIFAGPAEIEARSRRLAGALEPRLPEGHVVTLTPGVSRVGGGAAPAEELPTTLITIRPGPAGRQPSAARWEEALRKAPHPVVARIHEDALVVDLRTVEAEREDELIETLSATA